MAKFKKTISIFILIVSFMLFATVSAFALNEKEPNNSRTASGVLLAGDDVSCYGTITATGSSNGDFWKMSYSKAGMVNVYLGSVPSNLTYNLTLYKGSTQIASATTSGKTNALIKCKFDGTSTYYARIYCTGSTVNASDEYLFRCKMYEDLSAVTANMFSFAYQDVDTRSGITPSRNHIWNMGLGATEYLNNSVSAAYSVLPSSDIFLVCNNTSSGNMQFNKSATSITYLYASNSNPGTNNRSLSALSSTALSDVELAIYAGSSTTALATATQNKGAFCAVGFKKSIPDYKCFNVWIETFFSSCNEGDTVDEAISHASDAVASTYTSSTINSPFKTSNLQISSTASALVFN